LPRTAPRAARRLNPRLTYASACIQKLEEEIPVDDGRVVDWSGVAVPFSVIWIRCTKRVLLVSTGFGCSAMMNAVLIAENRPA